MFLRLVCSTNNKEANESNLEAPNYHIAMREYVEKPKDGQAPLVTAGLATAVQSAAQGGGAGITFSFNTTKVDVGEGTVPREEYYLVSAKELPKELLDKWAAVPAKKV